MSRVVDSSKFRLLSCTCSKFFLFVASVTILFIAVVEIVSIARKIMERSEKSTTTIPIPTKSPLTEIAKDVFLVHTIRDRRNRGEELRALVWAKQPNYNIECGMKNGIRMRASWYEMSGNDPSLTSTPSASSSDSSSGSQQWRAFYLTCNLPDLFFEKDLVESLCFVEHIPNEEAPRLGFRITGIDVDYDLPFLDPEYFELFYGLCVTLLDAGEFRPEDLVEFVEINRKLGAELITFMIRSEGLTEEMIAALDHYSDDPMIDLVDFSLPFPASEVHNNGENVARDICLHRHMNTTDHIFHCVRQFCAFRLVGFTTLREFFLPLVNASMVEALRDFPYYESGLIKVSALNVPVRSYAHPLTLNNKLRMEKLDHAVTRGIVRPRKVVEMGPNFAYHLVNSGRQFVVENNAMHMVLYRLTDEDKGAKATAVEQSITDVVPALADVYEEISRNIGAVFKSLDVETVGAKAETL